MARLNSQPQHERSAIARIFTDESEGPPYTVYVDCVLTRRKRHHIICDVAGGVVFRSRWFSDIVGWLASQQQMSYTLDTDGVRWKVSAVADE